MDVKRVASVADRGIFMKISMHNGGKVRGDACLLCGLDGQLPSGDFLRLLGFYDP